MRCVHSEIIQATDFDWVLAVWASPDGDYFRAELTAPDFGWSSDNLPTKEAAIAAGRAEAHLGDSAAA